MKNGIAHWLLLALSMAASLLAAELNPEMLEKLDFFLNYGIAEHLELLEQAPIPQADTALASAAAAGYFQQDSTQAVHISSSPVAVSTTTKNGGAQ